MRNFACATAGLLLLTGCASHRPVLYPNDYLKNVGNAQAEADIDQCMQLAREAGASGRSGLGAAATNTAAGAATGAASGAVGGAIAGNVGSGAAIGAASGATAGLIRSLFSRSQPSGAFVGFVNQCLQERGYKPVGWQ